jgi:hypothetical protein
MVMNNLLTKLQVPGQQLHQLCKNRTRGSRPQQDIWQHLRKWKRIWLHLTTSDHIWPHLTLPNNIWLHLTTSDYIWLHLRTSDYIWLHLTILYENMTNDRLGTRKYASTETSIFNDWRCLTLFSEVERATTDRQKTSCKPTLQVSLGVRTFTSSWIWPTANWYSHWPQLQVSPVSVMNNLSSEKFKTTVS